jgi:hypothetical protein
LAKGRIHTCQKIYPKGSFDIRFTKVKDPENYFREQLMICTPWRNEIEDLFGICQSYSQMYETLEHLILKNRQPFEFQSDILDKAIE